MPDAVQGAAPSAAGQKAGPRSRRRITAQTTLVLDPSLRLPVAVVCNFARGDWQARRPEEFGRAPHPGTALLIDGAWFEILAAREEPRAGGVRHVYEIAPWDDRFVFRGVDEITAESCNEAFELYRQEKERLERGRTWRKFPFLTGLLPRDVQRDLELNYGVPAMRATAISAATLMFCSGFLLLASWAANRGLNFGPSHRFFVAVFQWAPLLFLVFVESLVRFRLGMRLEDPLGSAFLALPYHLVRETATMFRRQSRKQPSTSEHEFSRVLDTVKPWPGEDADLAIYSRLPKDHWVVNRTGVRYQGEIFQLVDRDDLQDGKERHRFLLQRPRYEVLYHNIFDYSPEEVREIYRGRRRLKAATWVETFGVVFGLLDGERQQRLARTYRYEPERAALWMVLATIFIGAVNGVIAFRRMSSGEAIILDVAVFFFSFVLFWDSALRWGAWRDRRYRASLISFLVRGPADRALKWERSPHQESYARPIPAADDAEPDADAAWSDDPSE